ncbi:MAG: hypothetical protein HY941_08365 [Gammaproteobacteria bacterium]|nr:hypothetical protein [Gammaproteobacteria bacterium]
MEIFAALISVIALLISALGYRHSVKTNRIADRIIVSEKKNEIARIYLQIEFMCDRTSRKLAALYRGRRKIATNNN